MLDTCVILSDNTTRKKYGWGVTGYKFHMNFPWQIRQYKFCIMHYYNHITASLCGILKKINKKKLQWKKNRFKKKTSILKSKKWLKIRKQVLYKYSTSFSLTTLTLQPWKKSRARVRIVVIGGIPCKVEIFFLAIIYSLTSTV